VGIWTVWERQNDGEAAAVNATFVRDSFSWLAFLAPPLWLIANRMLVVFVALGLRVFAAGFAVRETGAGPEILAAAAPVLMLWFGFEARALKRWSLRRRGWTMTGVVEARRLRNAERRYFTERTSPARASALPRPLPAVPPVPREASA
jgi:hypothetical protein